jgi:hypothetical protein
MSATWTSSEPIEITPEQRRDEIISILAAGLGRLIGASEAAVGTLVDALGGMPTGELANVRGNALPGMPAEKLSESGEIGLELSRETRLSVPAGERPENG